MNKLKKVCFIVAVAVLGVLMISAEKLFAATSTVAKQLEKGIELYNQNKTEAAMDQFINVMVNGTPEQVATANQYVNKIHNQIGGIQTPVEVDVNFKEGAIREFDDAASDLELQRQNVQEAVQQQVADVNAAADEQAQNVQQALDEIDAQQKALAAQIEAKQAAMHNQVQAAADAAAASAAAATVTPEKTVAEELAEQGSSSVADSEPVAAQTVSQEAVGAAAVPVAASETQPAQAAEETTDEPADDETYAPSQQTVLTSVGEATASTTFSDLTSPDAVEARNLYTAQKIASMKQAALDKITAEKGVHLYMRDGQPDAIDFDDGVLFQGANFRSEALPLLNNVYELLALQQGAQYVILPAGAYTDDVTLAGMREAAALNSYLVKRGISQGKLTYNMGLVEEEAPAQFTNLKGLSIVFDYDAKLPTRLQQNENNETNPLLSMAIVPQCHAIDRSLGEAYAIDFSVLETVNGIDNWVLQVVQHGRDGNYYVVRQLEGFSPVYHQILWNGRKGIIGPELPCGKYTIVLTATDLKGNKQTLRRRVVVKCNSQQSDNITAFCGVKETPTQQAVVAKELDYKTERLWKKPARKMGGTKAATATATAQSTAATSETSSGSSTYTHTKTVTNIVTEDNSAPVTTTTSTVSAEDAYYGDMPAEIPTTNPYAQPYDDLN